MRGDMGKKNSYTREKKCRKALNKIECKGKKRRLKEHV
jgi:hypothetical protein